MPAAPPPSPSRPPCRPPPTPSRRRRPNNASAFAVVSLLLKQSGVYDDLNGEGPFTLFAPTDEAFAKLPDEVMGALLDPANREVLVTVLQNHVVEGERSAGSFIDDAAVELTTLAGETLSIEGEGELFLQTPAAPYVAVEDGRTVLVPSFIEASVPKVTITDAGGGAVPGVLDETGQGDPAGAIVTLPDITADNGIIHSISNVLVPQSVIDGLQ